MNTNEKRFWVRCPEDQYNQLKAMAEKEKLSLGELVLCKTLNLVPIEIKEEITYPRRKKNKKGEDYGYTQTVVKKKRIFKPASEVTTP